MLLTHKRLAMPLLCVAIPLLCLILPGGSSKVAANRTGNPCEDSELHGPSTDFICDGDALHTDQYLISPNGQWRIYFQSDGLTAMFYTGTDPWDAYEIYSYGYDNPSHMVYNIVNGYPTFSWYSWCEEGECLDHTLAGPVSGPTGGTCLQLGSIGLAVIWDQNCSNDFSSMTYLN